MSLCLSIDEKYDGHEDGKRQEVNQNNTGKQLSSRKAQVDVEEDGVPVAELLHQVHGDGGYHCFYYA
jgi:hypothetical protein